jgi:SAM-dependent methyltransferase
MINLFKVWKPLTDLLVVNKLFANPKILDLGSGPGSCTIGILLFYNALAKYNPDINFHLELTLLDRSEVFLKYAKELISIVNNHLEKNLTIRSTNISLCNINADTLFSQYGTKDLIVCSNFFPCNEADGNDANALSIANNLEEILDSNGSYIIIEPGDKNNSIGLNTIGNNIKKAGIWNEFSPCANIWENTDTNCCCFNCFRLHWIRPQSFSLFTYKEICLQHLNYSYKIFRLDGKRKYDFLCDYIGTSYIRLSEVNNNLNKKVNIICFIRTIINNERNKIKWLLCDGTNPTQDLKLSQDESKIKFLGEILGGELVQIKNCIIEKESPYRNRYIIKNVNDVDVKIFY